MMSSRMLAIVLVIAGAVVLAVSLSLTHLAPVGASSKPALYQPKLTIVITTSSGDRAVVDPVTVHGIALALAQLLPATFSAPVLTVVDTENNTHTYRASEACKIASELRITRVVLALGNISTAVCKPGPLDYKPCTPLVLNITLVPSNETTVLTGSTVVPENMTVNYAAVLVQTSGGFTVLAAHSVLPRALNLTANETVYVTVSLGPLMSVLGFIYLYNTRFGPLPGTPGYDYEIAVGVVANDTVRELAKVYYDWDGNCWGVIVSNNAVLEQIRPTQFYYYIPVVSKTPLNITGLVIRYSIYDYRAEEVFRKTITVETRPVVTVQIAPGSYGAVAGLYIVAR